jgi:hypothetical protein
MPLPTVSEGSQLTDFGATPKTAKELQATGSVVFADDTMEVMHTSEGEEALAKILQFHSRQTRQKDPTGMWVGRGRVDPNRGSDVLIRLHSTHADGTASPVISVYTFDGENLVRRAESDFYHDTFTGVDGVASQTEGQSSSV